MKQKTPFLTGFPTHLFGQPKTSAQAQIAKKRQQLLHGSFDLQQQFIEEVPPELLSRFSASERRRHYPDHLLFWAFLSQVLSDDASCAAAVAKVQALAEQEGLPIPSANTAGYCKARAELPAGMLIGVNRSLLEQLDAHLPTSARWRGLRPVAEDGTTAKMPDSDKNRETYPYPHGQKQGCGFPTVRIGALVDLSHGGLVGFATSDMNASELENHAQLEEQLHAGDVFIADRFYSSYEVIAKLHKKGVHSILRTHQARKINFASGKKIGNEQRLVVLKKPPNQPEGSKLNKQQWDALAPEITVRVIRYKGPDRDGKTITRYLTTTLLKPEEYPADEVTSLYAHRWDIEVNFRDIKTTLGMEMLRTKSPEMIDKELIIHQLAYNLLRLMMLKAAVEHQVNHRRLSFRGTQQTILAFAHNFRNMAMHPIRRMEKRTKLWARIAERSVIERPGRNEPRRVKRRPKCTRWIQKTRHEYFEHFRSDFFPAKILDNLP